MNLKVFLILVPLVFGIETKKLQCYVCYNGYTSSNIVINSCEDYKPLNQSAKLEECDGICYKEYLGGDVYRKCEKNTGQELKCINGNLNMPLIAKHVIPRFNRSLFCTKFDCPS